jgi:hypothetical protein
MPRKQSAKAERERRVNETAREQDRAAMGKRKAALEKAKKAKRKDMSEARTQCKLDRERTKDATRASYQRTVEKARAKRDEARSAARERCDVGKRAVNAQHDPEIQKAAKDLEEERKFQKGTRRIGANNKNRERERKRVRGSAIAKMQEANEEVEQNLPPELVPVWRSVRGRIKAGPRRSRLEAFQEYIHEHPEVVAEVQERQAAKRLAELEKQAEQFYAERKGQPRKTGPRREDDPDLGDVVAEAMDEVFGFFDELADQAQDQRAA